ncbi:RDD family protein [candidate division KSB1 bacterium]|nr:RDD family protein [candidate division KSB1 bacterium]
MSDFRFSCPHCGKNLSVNTSMIGKKGTCNFCSGIVVVPRPETDSTVQPAIGSKSSGFCPYCQTEIAETDHIQECPVCKTPHHSECWLENNGCSVYGCEMAPPDEEKIVVKAPAPSPSKNNTMWAATWSMPPNGNDHCTTLRKSHASGPQIRPWVRYWARMIDVFLFSFLFGIILSVVFESEFYTGRHISSFIISFSYLFAEPILLCSWGTTPGKAMLKIKLRKNNGAKLSHYHRHSRWLA